MKLKKSLFFSIIIFSLTQCFGGGGSGGGSSSSDSFDFKSEQQVANELEKLSEDSEIAPNASILSSTDTKDLMYSLLYSSTEPLRDLSRALTTLNEIDNADTTAEFNAIDGVSANENEIKVNKSDSFQTIGDTGGCNGSYKMNGVANQSGINLDAKARSNCVNFEITSPVQNPGFLKALTKKQLNKKLNVSRVILNGSLFDHEVINGPLEAATHVETINGMFRFTGNFKGKLGYSIKQRKTVTSENLNLGTNYQTEGNIILISGDKKVVCTINTNSADGLANILLSSVCGENENTPPSDDPNIDPRFDPNNSPTDQGADIENDDLNPIEPVIPNFSQEFLEKFNNLENPDTESIQLDTTKAINKDK